MHSTGFFYMLKANVNVCIICIVKGHSAKNNSEPYETILTVFMHKFTTKQ